MNGRRLYALTAVLVGCTPPAAPAPPAPPLVAVPAPEPTTSPADRWWSHVAMLASDAMEGRNTGSPGFARAADYVTRQLQEVGAEPGAGTGFRQRFALEARTVREPGSRVALVRGGKEEPVAIGPDLVVSTRPEKDADTDAALVFAGYCLSIPEIGHDDFAGLDLKGKLAVCVGGGPGAASPPVRAHASSHAVRWEALRRAGAIGSIMIQNPKSMDVPWERSSLTRKHPSMGIADPQFDETPSMRFAASWNPAEASKLFGRDAKTSFEEILALANADRPLPHFPLAARLRAHVAYDRAPVEAENVVGVLRGTDPALRDELVVLSAHLDHLGIGEPIGGDAVYNGAMDNASGVAALLEVARSLKVRPRRSLVFAFVTGEEKGLLGSRMFAERPPLAGRFVADVNVDMFMPLHPMKYVVGYGADESTLKAPLEAAARASGIGLLPDREPNRVLFVRSDQYSFVRTGVPSLALKIGYETNSPEAALHKTWLKERYHAPSDDLAQPLDREAAAAFTRFVTDLVRAIADGQEPPAWNEASFFKRFARAR